MPKVRVLSGSQKGAVLELPQTEAEAAIDTGSAEPVTEPAPAKKKRGSGLLPAVNPRK